MTGPNAPPALRRLALVTIGSVSVGIDVACVVQALPLPPVLAPLPRRRGALVGVVECAGVLVPVADLARWVETGPPAADGAARRILVLQEGGRTIGLLADAVAGFADLSAAAVARLHHDDDPDEVFQACAQVAETGAVVSILEVGRLVALACAWHDAPEQAIAAPAVATAGGAITTLCAVLQVGTALLALPATSLAAVTARPSLERVGMGGSAFCRWNDRHVPVVAVDAAAPDTRALLAILEHDGALLGIGIDAALDMRALTPPAPDAPATIHDATGQAIDFVDVPALFGRYPETALSVRPAAVTVPASARAANTQAQLVFDAGGTMATPIDAVAQVLPFDASDDIAPSTMPWQGRTIAVTDLRLVRGSGAVLVLRMAPDTLPAWWSGCVRWCRRAVGRSTRWRSRGREALRASSRWLPKGAW